MKTKIKRHSRSVISVILAVCMVISCMTVGIIATDAAETFYTSGTNVTIYYDNSLTKWSNVYFRIGRNDNNGSNVWTEAYKMTKVSGTESVYKYTISTAWNQYQAFNFSNGAGNTGNGKSIYQSSGTDRTVYKKFALSGSTTYYFVGQSTQFNTNYKKCFGLSGSGDVEADTTASNYTTYNKTVKVNSVDNAVVTASYTTGNGGTIAEGKSVSVLSGTTITVNVNSDQGYGPSAITVSNANNAASATIESSGGTAFVSGNAQSNVSVTMERTEEVHDVLFTAGTGGTINPSGTVAVGEETQQTVRAIPSTGYAFSGYTLGTGIDQKSGGSTSTIKIVTKSSGNYTVDASFSQVDYTLTKGAEDSTVGTFSLATESADPATTAHYGDTVTVTCTPAQNGKIKKVTYTPAGGSETKATRTNDTTYTFTMPAANTTVNVTYVDVSQANITFGANDPSKGYVSVGKYHDTSSNVPRIEESYISGESSVPEGTVVSFSAIPVNGKKFVGWYTDSGCTSGHEATGFTAGTQTSRDVTVTKGSGAITLYAKFADAPDTDNPLKAGSNELVLLIYSPNNNYLNLWGGYSNANYDFSSASTTTISSTTYKIVRLTVTSANEVKCTVHKGNEDFTTESKDLTGMHKGKTYKIDWNGSGKKATSGDDEASIAEYTPPSIPDPNKYEKDTYPVFLEVTDNTLGTTYAPAYVDKNTQFTVNHTPNAGYKTNISTDYTSPTHTGVTLETSTTMTMPNAYNSETKVTVDYVPKDKYTVTFTANNAAYGTVEAEDEDGNAIPSGVEVFEDTNVTFTATPAAYHYFVKWNDGTNDYATNTKILTITDNTTMTATFQPESYYIVSGGTNMWPTGTEMTKLDSGLFVSGALKDTGKYWFKVRRASDNKVTKSTVSAGGDTEPSDGTKVKPAWAAKGDSWEATYSYSTDSTDNRYVWYNPATNELWVSSSNTAKSLTLAENDDAVITATYGSKTIEEGETLAGIPVGETVTISVTPNEGKKCTAITSSGGGTVAGSRTIWTVAMPNANTTITATMGAVEKKRIYFNNYYTRYNKPHIYAWYGAADRSEILREASGSGSGDSMYSMANSAIYWYDIPEDCPYVMFTGNQDEWNTGVTDSETISGVVKPYYHVTIPWDDCDNAPMYTAGKDQTNPALSETTTTDHGYWKKYTARTNEYTITSVEKGNAEDNTEIFTGLSATLYDYFVDTEYTSTGKWLDIGEHQYTESHSGSWHYNPYQTFNDSIDANARTFDVAVPLYFGNFYDKVLKQPLGNGSTNTLVQVSGGKYDDEYYYNYKGLPNNSNALSDSSHKNAVTGLSGKTLSKGNIHYYDGADSNENGQFMAMFDEDFLSGENVYEKELATILRSSQFPVRKKTVTYSGTDYPYYEFNSNGGEDNAYVTNINKDDKEAELKYYHNEKKVYAADMNNNLGKAGFFPFDYAYASDGTTALNDQMGKVAHDLGFGMKVEIPFTINKNGTLDKVASNDNTDTRSHQKFEFSGDDDLWVFLDGNLVLDLGGDHNATQGTIDFATMTIYGSTDEDDGTTKAISQQQMGSAVRNGSFASWFDNTKENDVHTLTLYYVERGMWDSNLRFGFSFHAVPSKFTTEKDVKADGINNGFFDQTTAFTTLYGNEKFDIEHKVGTTADDLSLATGKIYTIGKTDGTITAENPTYQLKNGEQAIFNDQFDNAIEDVYMSLKETSANTNVLNYDPVIEVFDLKNNRALIAGNGEADEGYSFKFADGGLESADAIAIFTNNIKYHKLSINKVLSSGDEDANFSFKIEVSFDNGTTWQTFKLSGSAYKDGKIQQKTADANGIVNGINHGHTVSFDGIPENAMLRITEILPAHSKYQYNNASATGAALDSSTVTNGIQFTMGEGDVTATFNNNEGELTISHTLHPDSPADTDADCVVTATVKSGNDTIDSFSAINGELEVPAEYIKSDSDYTLEVTLTTEPENTSVLDSYYEKVTTGNAFTELTNSNALGLSATVSVNVSGNTATISFPIRNLFSDSSTQKVKSMPFYSLLSKVHYYYYVKYTYTSRLYSTQYYVAKGELEVDEIKDYLTFNNGTPSFNAANKESFLAAKSPYEDNYKETITWNFSSADNLTLRNNTPDTSDGQKTFVTNVSATQTPARMLDVVFNFPYDYSKSDSDPSAVWTFTPTVAEGKSYPANADSTLWRQTVPYLERFTLNHVTYADIAAAKEDAKTDSSVVIPEPTFILTPEKVIYTVEGNEIEKPFNYWSVCTMNSDGSKGTEYMRCYSRFFNLALYQNAYIEPVYKSSNEEGFVDPKNLSTVQQKATLGFLENSRNHWNEDGGGSVRTNWHNQGDRLFSDFVISFDYKGIELKEADPTKYQAGLVIENVADVNTLSAETAAEQAAALQNQDTGLAEDTIDAIEAFARQKDSTSRESGNFLISPFAVTKLDNKNSIEYYYSFANIKHTDGSATERKNRIYRAVSYLYDIEKT